MQIHNQKGKSLFGCETAYLRDLSRDSLKDGTLFVQIWLNVFEEYLVVIV